MIMKKTLGVFLIRGAGKEGSGEQEKFVSKLNIQLKKSGVDPEQIHYEYASWYGPTQMNEDKLSEKLSSWNAGSHLGYWITRKIRKQVASYIKRVME
jgi:hypothetical protein